MRFRFDELELDTDRPALRGPAGEIGLSATMLRVLSRLLERAPATVSAEELIEAGWPRQPVGKSTLRQTIAALREALSDEGPEFRLIANRHGVGYQFIGPVVRPGHDDGKAERPAGPALPIAVAALVVGLILVLGIPQFTATDPPETEPEPAARGYRQAQTLLERHEYDAVLDFLTPQSGAGEEPGQLALPLARALAARGDFPAARQLLADVAGQVEQWPRRQRLEWEALSAELAFEFEAAVERYQALNQYYPDRRISRDWIQALIKAGRLDEAESALEALENTYPDEPLNALLEAELANAGEDQERRLAAAHRAEARAAAQELPALRARALITAADAQTNLGRLEAARATLDQLGPPGELATRVQADQAMARAEMLFREGSYPESRAELDAAEALYESLNAHDGVARARVVRGNILEMSGEAEPAMEQIALAIERLEQVGDPQMLARAHVNLGISQTRAGLNDSALENLELAQGYFRRIGNARGEGIALLNVGTLLASDGRRIEAQPAFERALEAFEAAADERGRAIALSNLAGLASGRRDTEAAIALNQRALEIFEALQARPDMGRVMLNLGLAYRRRGELSIAEESMRQAGETFAELGIVPSQARSLINLGRLLLDQGRIEETRDVLETLRNLELDSATEQSGIDRLASSLASAQGRLNEADRLLAGARDRLGEDGDSPHHLLVDLDRAAVELARGETVLAEREGRRLADRFAALDYPNERALALMIFIEALMDQGRLDEAANWLLQVESLLDDAPDAKQLLELALLRSRLEAPDQRASLLETTRARAEELGFLAIEARAQEQIAQLADP